MSYSTLGGTSAKTLRLTSPSASSSRSRAVSTAGFRVLYVLVVLEVSSRRILHCNVTAR